MKWLYSSECVPEFRVEGSARIIRQFLVLSGGSVVIRQSRRCCPALTTG
jgi:hypothetical protein